MHADDYFALSALVLLFIALAIAVPGSQGAFDFNSRKDTALLVTTIVLLVLGAASMIGAVIA